ncbi:MAG: guanylate kinase [bacterium]
MASGKLIVITGPSASGKTTIAVDLLASDPKLVRLVTCTTRAPRPNEKDGIDYNFLDRTAFEQGIKSGEFFEWADVYGDFYGSRKRDVDEKIAAGRSVVVVLDAKGASTIKQTMPQAIVIFVKAPIEELKRRLMQRIGFTSSDVAKRVAKLESELQLSTAADYVVENHDGHFAEALISIRDYLKNLK